MLFQQLLHDLVHFDLEFKLGLFEGFVFLDYVCVTEELGIAVVFDHVIMFDPLDALLFQPRVFFEPSLPFFSTYVAAVRILLILFQSYNFQAILAILINDEIHQVFGLNFLLVQLQSIKELARGNSELVLQLIVKINSLRIFQQGHHVFADLFLFRIVGVAHNFVDQQEGAILDPGLSDQTLESVFRHEKVFSPLSLDQEHIVVEFMHVLV